MKEHQIIKRIFAPLTKGAPNAFGLEDDAALVTPDKGYDLVVTKDALVAGVHFFADDAPFDIGYKALAVNLSDLAAKGAEPVAYVLAVALPQGTDLGWLEHFAAGLAALQEISGVHLIGGDTVITPGQLTISITAFGQVEHGKFVRRSGAKPGDHVYVTGTIGDSVLGLKLRKQRESIRKWGLTKGEAEFLNTRYLRPAPRMKLASVLCTWANAALDISDGLAGDFRTLCKVSHVGGCIEAGRIPFSSAAKKVLIKDPDSLETMLSGGDDYEILAAVSEEKSEGFEKAAQARSVPVSCIGHVTSTSEGVVLLGDDGIPLVFENEGYDHFL